MKIDDSTHHNIEHKSAKSERKIHLNIITNDDLDFAPLKRVKISRRNALRGD
mgnify:CR=1 FL=1